MKKVEEKEREEVLKDLNGQMRIRMAVNPGRQIAR